MSENNYEHPAVGVAREIGHTAIILGILAFLSIFVVKSCEYSGIEQQEMTERRRLAE